jgi:hypothetical protein
MGITTRRIPPRVSIAFLLLFALLWTPNLNAQQVTSYPPPAFKGAPPMLPTFLTSTTTVFGCNYPATGIGTTTTSSNESENWLLPLAVAESLTGDFVIVQLHVPANVYNVSNGASQGQGYSVSAGPVTSGNITQGQTYALTVSGVTLSEKFVDNQTLNAPYEYQTNTRTLTSTYNMVTGIQTLSWDYEFEQKVSYDPDFAGCDSHTVGSETGTATYNFQTQSIVSRLQIAPELTFLTPTAGAQFTSPPFIVSGGVPPYSWSVSTLPGGLELASGGVQATIQGTPAAPSDEYSIDVDGEIFDYSGGTYSLTVTDQTGATATAAFGMTVLFDPFVPLPTPAKTAALQAGLKKSVEGFAIALGIVACEAVPACAPEGVVEAPALLGLEGALAKSAAGDYLQALDPPDPNYTVIATPQQTSPPVVEAGGEISAPLATALNNLVANEMLQVSLKLAMVTSLNRASGAEVANNTVWEMNQLQAAKWYSLQLSPLLANEGNLRQAVASNLEGTNLDIALSSTSINQEIQGGSIAAQSFLESAGISQEEITFIQGMVSHSNIEFNGTTLSGTLANANTIAALSQEAVAYGTFGADRNQDGLVNCADLQVVKHSFGAIRGQATYNAMADVNMDGIVNVLDLALIAKQIPAGTTCQ